MLATDWVILDTETTGIAGPIFVVDLAAQRMRGWEPIGRPFRRLLNHDQDIPPEASRVHGYTREILERDGEPPHEVYAEFREFAAGMEMVSYNVEFDWDKVLIPEWRRLGISPIGKRGWCALRLAQRLLDPVPAGNCKLQTLRQYYRLEEHGAHTALGDVLTVVDLLGSVLRPMAEQRGLRTWEEVSDFSGAEWYPSRLAFGVHKGKSVYEARENRELRKWLESLAHSSNPRSARMGRWYLRQLEMAEPDLFFVAPVEQKPMDSESSSVPMPGLAVVIYQNPELKRLHALVEAARDRLAELEVAYTLEKAEVVGLQVRLFQCLRPHYQQRDLLRIIVNYRRQFVEMVLREGEEEASYVEKEFRQAKENNEREYEEVAGDMAQRRQPSAEEENELLKLWKKLVKLYHPDRFAHEPKKLETYSQLTAAINRAKDNGDLELLREIARDPHTFIFRQGWVALDFRDDQQAAQLRKLWESLELEIVSVLEATNQLRESAEFELYRLVRGRPEMFDCVVEKHAESTRCLKVSVQPSASGAT